MTMQATAPTTIPEVSPAPSKGDALPIEGLVNRTLPLAGYSGVVLACLFVQMGLMPVLSAVAGLLLNLLGLYSLNKLVPMVLRPADAPEVDRTDAVKFALLHLASITVVLPALFVLHPWGFLAGYSYPLVILVLKAAGRLFFGEKPAVGRAAVVVLACGLLLPGQVVRASEHHEEAAVEHHAEEAAGHGAAAHGEDAAHGGEHGEEGHGEHHGPPHVPTLGDVLNSSLHYRDTDAYKNLSLALGLRKADGTQAISLEYLGWYFFTIVLLIALLGAVCGSLKQVPKGLQSLLELYYGFIEDMVVGVIGEDGKRYIPFIATLFLFILAMNYLGMVPLYNGPTAVINTTAALAICVFCYAQYEGIRTNGVKHYLMHFVGEPLWMAPLMFPLHVIGEFIKPLSLALRLFGNLTGEHILAAGFITLIAGIGFIGSIGWLPLPIPVHLPLLFLGLLVGFIQAMVFALLATIYIALLLPHDDHGHEAAAH